MNIIDILVQDHDRIRKELVEIHRALSHGDLRSKIRIFLSSYELHESIEEEILLPTLDLLPEDARSEKLLPPYAKMHEAIWELLDHMMDILNHADFGELSAAFFKFDAVIEAHFRFEESSLFPAIQQIIGEKLLRSLGKQAAQRLSHFGELKEII